MDFSSSQDTEFFYAPEEILEGERSGQGEGRIESPHSDTMSPFRPASSGGESEPPHPGEQVPTMRLLPPSTEKSYVAVKALIEEVNKTASRQGYNVMMKWGNRKDKKWGSAQGKARL